VGAGVIVVGLNQSAGRSVARSRLTAVVILAAIVAACGGRPITPTPGGHFTAVASWYGEPFHGRLTASGERYNMHGLSAAHRSLPFGTRLKVTNPESGQSSVVTVNDRGPFIRGRHLDLSYGAAKEIGLIGAGVGRVAVEVLDRDVSYRKVVREEASSVAGSGSFAIQFGAFRDPENAARLKRALELETTGVMISRVTIDGAVYHRVRIAPFASREDALARARAFAEEGYDTAIVAR
jgi:rare lipoprotein A